MKARIKITLKNGVLDPQGKAIEGAIKGLGISGVGDVRCKDLLANTVIENYSYEIG